MLVHGDCLEVLRSMEPEWADFAYGDPPFCSGRDFGAFDDRWPSIDQYLACMRARIEQVHRALKPTGTFCLHIDTTAGHLVRAILDDVFGRTRFVNEVVWVRSATHGSARHSFPAVHDVLLWYAKGDSWTWHELRAPLESKALAKFSLEDERGCYRDVDLTGPGRKRGPCSYPWRGISPDAMGRHWQIPRCAYEAYERLAGQPLRPTGLDMSGTLESLNAMGLIHWSGNGKPRAKLYRVDAQGPLVGDVWCDVPPVNARSNEHCGYPTQKPVALLERILGVATSPGDAVLDPWCGSGTTLVAAERMGRRWVGIDRSEEALRCCRARLHPEIDYRW